MIFRKQFELINSVMFVFSLAVIHLVCLRFIKRWQWLSLPHISHYCFITFEVWISSVSWSIKNVLITRITTAFSIYIYTYVQIAKFRLTARVTLQCYSHSQLQNTSIPLSNNWGYGVYSKITFDKVQLFSMFLRVTQWLIHRSNTVNYTDPSLTSRGRWPVTVQNEYYQRIRLSDDSEEYWLFMFLNSAHSLRSFVNPNTIVSHV